MKIQAGLRGVAGVYVIRNVVNGKVYVGSSRNVGKRLGGHRAQLEGGRHANLLLTRAWIKYGPDAFAAELLERVDAPSELLVREQAWLDDLRPFGDRGYNILEVAGSNAGWRHSDEAKLKIASASAGRVFSPETLERMRQAQQQRSPEWRQALSESLQESEAAKAALEKAVQVSADKRRGQPAHPNAAKGASEWYWSLSEQERADFNEKRAAPMRGRARSPEAVEAARAGWHAMEPEKKAALSEQRRQQMTGRKLTPETIAKRQETRRRNDLLRKESLL